MSSVIVTPEERDASTPSRAVATDGGSPVRRHNPFVTKSRRARVSAPLAKGFEGEPGPLSATALRALVLLGPPAMAIYWLRDVFASLSRSTVGIVVAALLALMFAFFWWGTKVTADRSSQTGLSQFKERIFLSLGLAFAAVGLYGLADNGSSPVTVTVEHGVLGLLTLIGGGCLIALIVAHCRAVENRRRATPPAGYWWAAELLAIGIGGAGVIYLAASLLYRPLLVLAAAPLAYALWQSLLLVKHRGQRVFDTRAVITPAVSRRTSAAKPSPRPPRSSHTATTTPAASRSPVVETAVGWDGRVETVPAPATPATPANRYADPEPTTEIPDPLEVLERIRAYPSLEEAKRAAEEIVAAAPLQTRADRPLDRSELNLVLVGEPGTGRELIADELASLYHALGLSNGNAMRVDAVNLYEAFAATGPDAMETLDGGLLVVHDVHELIEAPRAGAGWAEKESLKRLRDVVQRGRHIIVLIGEPAGVKELWEREPEIASRIPRWISCGAYEPADLTAIAEHMVAATGESLAADAQRELATILEQLHRQRGHKWANADEVVALLTLIRKHQRTRLGQTSPISKETRGLLTLSDVREARSEYLAARRPDGLDDELTVSEIRQRFEEEHPGMEAIQRQLDDLGSELHYQRRLAEEGIESAPPNLGFAFVGPPGTGKTESARYFGQLLRAQGLLRRGHVVDVDRAGLVHEHVGGTERRTKEVCLSALGGVLLVDEAYALADAGSENRAASFGQRAIETLLKFMEDHRGELAVVFTGYRDDMERFLAANEGLRSRIPHEIEFEDYSARQLVEIARAMLTSQGLVWSEEADWQLLPTFEQLFAESQRGWGNARAVRNLIAEARRSRGRRLRNEPDATREELMTLNLDDLHAGAYAIRPKAAARRNGLSGEPTP